MKRLITITLAATLAAAVPFGVTACGQKVSEGSGAAETEAPASSADAEFATLGDVLAAETESMMSTFDEQRYVCGFCLDGTWWRVEAALPEGMFDELNEVWVEDQTKVEELLSPLQVSSATKLEAPSDDELAALAGKTGADLAADGFAIGSLVVNGSVTDASATKGSFDYLVTFDGAVEDENTEDPAGAVAGMSVTEATIQSISWQELEGE